MLEKSDEIAPLKAWEFQELGLQAAQRVAEIQGEEALQILQFTSQNFPTQAKSLLHVEVSPDFRKEMKHNADVLGKYLNLQAPDAALFVNGLFFDAETLDIGSLLETLRTELRVLDGLYKLSKWFFFFFFGLISIIYLYDHLTFENMIKPVIFLKKCHYAFRLDRVYILKN